MGYCDTASFGRPFRSLICFILMKPTEIVASGTQMMHEWETAMAIRGYKYVMTSTQADENAWKFYEKLGYHKVGGFFPPEQEAKEWMYLKRLGLSD